MGDAGSFPGGAQIPMGAGALNFINGVIGMPLLAGIDFEDMFLINIVDPMNFRATTDPMDPELPQAFANFDTQLWLFRPTMDPLQALGFLGNDDHPDVPGSHFSLLTPMPTDGSPPLTEAGLYFIAISRAGNNPASDLGPIFLQATPQEISGPAPYLFGVSVCHGDYRPHQGDRKIFDHKSFPLGQLGVAFIGRKVEVAHVTDFHLTQQRVGTPVQQLHVYAIIFLVLRGNYFHGRPHAGRTKHEQTIDLGTSIRGWGFRPKEQEVTQ